MSASGITSLSDQVVLAKQPSLSRSPDAHHEWEKFRLRLAEIQSEQARLLDITTDAVIVRDPNDTIVHWNRGAELLYGWQRNEAIGRNSHELLRTVFPAPLAEIKQALLQSGRWEGEFVQTTRSGTTLSVASRWSAQGDALRGAVGILECNIDITERKRAEDALRSSQASYLAEAQRLSRTGSFGWNAASAKLFWSEETFRIFEYEPTVIPSTDLILQRTHPDDVAVVRRQIERVAAGATELDFEHRLLMPDGSIKHVHVVAHTAPHGDVHGQLIGAVSDVTVRKQAYAALEYSEQRYRHIFNYMPIALIQLKAHGLIGEFERLRAKGLTDIGAHFDAHPHLVRQYVEQMFIEEVNEHTVRMLGGRAAGDVVGHTVSRHWPDVSLETVRRALESRYRSDAYFQEETKWATLDGRLIDVVFTSTRFARIGDTGLSLVGVVDITERVHAREMLTRMQADFAHAARISVLGELTASIAHEINQPLAAIAANGQAGLRWLQSAKPDLIEVRELTQDIVADAERAANIIGRVRTMAARRSPEQTLLSLDEIIREALLFLRHELQSRRVAVSHFAAPNAPKVLGDRTQLQQLVVNLVVNSIQAMAQAESPTRKITIKSSVPDSSSVHCQIEDSGPGVKPELLSRLFESFFTTKDNGMGMGLPICRSIIEAHGGRITVDNSGSEGGACFSFALPTAGKLH